MRGNYRLSWDSRLPDNLLIAAIMVKIRTQTKTEGGEEGKCMRVLDQVLGLLCFIQ